MTPVRIPCLCFALKKIHPHPHLQTYHQVVHLQPTPALDAPTLSDARSAWILKRVSLPILMKQDYKLPSSLLQP